MKEQKPSVTQIIEFLEDKKENKEIVEEELLNTIIVYLDVLKLIQLLLSLMIVSGFC